MSATGGVTHLTPPACSTPALTLHIMSMFGAIEAGGTKFNCAVMHADGRTLAQTRLATTDPQTTLNAVTNFFIDAQTHHGALSALGVAAFGPIDVRTASPTFGCLQSTPKAGWSGVNLLAPLRALNCPLALDTDVNAAALAEWQRGAGRNTRSLVYVTVGTGIGGGAVMDGNTLQGRLHPEMGHILVRRHPLDHSFKGCCPFHGDCLEGLASGPAILARWGNSLDQLPADHPAYDIVGYYLGQLAAHAALMLSVERVVFGGGVMQCTALVSHIRRSTHTLLNGYLPLTSYAGYMDDFIQLPGLQDRSGILGAWLLAQRACNASCN